MDASRRLGSHLTLVVLVTVALPVGRRAWATERWVPSQYPTIQSAIDACVDGDEVVIEPNTYTGDGNRDIDFGGTNITVRSVDPNDPNVVAATIIHCNPDDPNDPDDPNYYADHRGLYFDNGEGPSSVVAGLTITNGYVSYHESGGGIYCSNGTSPTLIKCSFSGNSAGWEGGGIYCGDGSSPTLIDCSFSGNSARAYEDGEGGGIYCDSNSSPTLTHCTLFGNHADWGGGIYCGSGSATLTNCTFAGNDADDGGGIYCGSGSATLTNCTFAGNSANYGGGIYCGSNSSPTVTNCTFTGNSAYSGGGIWCGEIMCDSNSSPILTNCTFTGNSVDVTGAGGGIASWCGNPTLTNCTLAGNSADWGGGIWCAGSNSTLTNCVLWDNTGSDGPQIALVHWVHPSTLTVSYCDIQGGPNDVYVEPNCTLIWDPNTNIDADPLFVDPDGADDDPNTWDDNDYHLSGNSPCIDAGDPNTDPNGQTDLDGEPRLMGDHVDMGSDEYPWYTLTLKLKDPGPSTVEIEPNDPNWPALAYPPGTELTLTAVPGGDKTFKKWKVWDPNHPGDGNYIVIDTNNPLYLTMDADYKVKAFFKCGGGGMVPLLLMLLGLVGLMALRRRNRA